MIANSVLFYLKREIKPLCIITVSGIIYNIGMTAGPWFEGQLAQCLSDIIYGGKTGKDMLLLAGAYVLVIFIVQFMRYVKRLFVRRFANHMNRDMKEVLYHNLIHKKKSDYENESVGAIMTKAISDVDVCVEGIRKFTTEIFDTGVVMVAYLAMLFSYDWRLTLLSIVFLPVAYLLAEKLKKAVSNAAGAYKETAGKLNGVTLDRMANAMTYRVYGQEKNQAVQYEKCLMEYEKKAVRANVLETALQPLYAILSMTGVIFILWFGAKNVLNEGWKVWDIAAFTTFLSCFTRLAAKSSKAAKLFNAVQKAKVSWKRIKPYLQEVTEIGSKRMSGELPLTISHLSFHYPGKSGEEDIFKDISLTAVPGEIIGVTGRVACGKSTFGKVFLCEAPYEGSIRIGGRELSELIAEGYEVVSYMGHEPELLSGSIYENVMLGSDTEDISTYIKAVCMDAEVKGMQQKEQTIIGNGGVRLSGGQQARVALARTMRHKRPIMILDDPFSAVDSGTEAELMQNLRKMAADSIVIILSHRLTQFPKMDQVIWMENGKTQVSTHGQLRKENVGYAELYNAQVHESKLREGEIR